MVDLKVGDTIYGRNGQPVKITGETSVSWVIGDKPWNQEKIKKAAMRRGNSGERYTQYFVSLEDALDCVFCANHSYSISQMVSVCRDGKTLREIARLIGFTEPVR